jgi:hypothetical protein
MCRRQRLQPDAAIIRQLDSDLFQSEDEENKGNHSFCVIFDPTLSVDGKLLHHAGTRRMPTDAS